jgi:hydroxyacylglutathione hydrolase
VSARIANRVLELLPVPALADNYVWVLHDGHAAVAVDPGEAAPVAAALGARSLALAAIFLTHHHADHVGGAAALAATHGCAVYAPDDTRIAVPHAVVRDGDVIRVEALGARFDVLAVPGHTTTHVAMHGHGAVFCGDTLFSVGCGRLFEGTPAQMLDSLGRLAALPAATRVCCGHEYTVSNCRFARTVEPGNAALALRSADAERLRAEARPTVPSTIADERATNPFLRSDAPAVRGALGLGTELDRDSRIAAFAALRARKDAFR